MRVVKAPVLKINTSVITGVGLKRIVSAQTFFSLPHGHRIPALNVAYVSMYLTCMASLLSMVVTAGDELFPSPNILLSLAPVAVLLVVFVLAVQRVPIGMFLFSSTFFILSLLLTVGAGYAMYLESCKYVVLALTAAPLFFSLGVIFRRATAQIIDEQLNPPQKAMTIDDATYVD